LQKQIKQFIITTIYFSKPMKIKKFILGLTTGLLITLIPMAFATTPSPKSFTDVDSSDWFYDAVNYLSAKKIVSGYDGEFKPKEPISRSEVSKMVYLTHQDLDAIRDILTDLRDQVDGLQAKVETIEFEGTCYYDDEWLNEGETNSVDGCTCQSNGSLSCPSAE
jgi:hypothetical protein